jgi:hypothetical protein
VAAGKKSGKEIDHAGKPFEKQVQEATGGKPETVEGREIDGVTDEALIQAKDTDTAATKSHNFLNKKTRTQIKETIRLARERLKRAEFWFKSEPHPIVRKYIEDKGGIVVICKD